MIVQCEHCQTKYRIADEKVKGKGIKVRCAKCENLFTVAPPENEVPEPVLPTPAPTPPAPPAPDPPQPEPQRQTATDQAGAGASSESGLTGPAQEQAVLPPLPSEGGGADPDLPEEGSPSLPPDPVSNVSDGFELPEPESGPADTGSPRPAHEMDQAELAPSKPGPAPEPPADLEEEGFEIEGTMREGISDGPDPFGSSSTPQTASASLETGTGADWGNIAIDDQSSPDSPGDFGLGEPGGYEPPPPVPFEEEQPPLSGPQEGSSAATTTMTSHPSEPAPSGKGRKGLVFLLLIVLLGAGGYFAYPRVMDMLPSKGEQPAGTLTPAGIQVKALSHLNGNILYSVSGEVRNDSANSVGMIQVEAQFRNSAGDVLARATAYCGNLFEEEELVRLKFDQVRSDLQNELGQSLSNQNVAPGQAVPFLVVLENPPADISKVTVSIISFKETT